MEIADFHGILGSRDLDAVRENPGLRSLTQLGSRIPKSTVIAL